MVAGCGPKIAKLCLFILNFLLWASSLVLIAAGSYVTAKHNDYEDLFAENTMVVVTAITIGVGLFTFIVSFAGCCGAIKESKCLLKLYFTFLLLIILMETTAVILGFVFSDDLEQSMMDGMQRTINETYGMKTGATEAVDEVQNMFDCCGANGFADYKNSLHLTPGLAVPDSCCKKNGTYITDCTAGAKGQPVYPDLVWSDGCVPASKQAVKDNYLLIGAVGLGLLVFEILTMVFSCCVIKGIDRDDYEKFV